MVVACTCGTDLCQPVGAARSSLRRAHQRMSFFVGRGSGCAPAAVVKHWLTARFSRWRLLSWIELSPVKWAALSYPPSSQRAYY